MNRILGGRYTSLGRKNKVKEKRLEEKFAKTSVDNQVWDESKKPTYDYCIREKIRLQGDYTQLQIKLHNELVRLKYEQMREDNEELISLTKEIIQDYFDKLEMMKIEFIHKFKEEPNDIARN